MHTRNMLFAVAFACLAALAAALYLQHFKDMLPCPLCVIQRYIFLGIALACLLGLAFGKARVGAAVALAGVLGGIGTAGKQLYVLAHPGLSCGIDPIETSLNKIVTAQYLPFLFKADGLCEDATMPFFGLSIPQWSMACFVLLGAALVWALARRK
ncbi:MAG: disulfide bond formation protein B [Pseudomonadota bacterium]